MGNKVSATRYPNAIQVNNLPEGKDVTNVMIVSAILELTHDEMLNILSGLHKRTPIDFKTHSIIYVMTSTGKNYWDISFEDERALKMFSKRISMDFFSYLNLSFKTKKDPLSVSADEVFKQFAAAALLEEITAMPNPPLKPHVRR